MFSYYKNDFKRLKRKCSKACDIPSRLLEKLYHEKHLRLRHPVGVVISPNAQFGKNCMLHQNVTIGEKNGKAPVLGDNIVVFANAVVIGDIHIGNNAVIGAGSVVLKDVPANEIWAGNPARFIKKID